MLHNFYGQSVSGPVMLQNKIQPESIKCLRPSNVAKTNTTGSKRLVSNAVSTMFTLGFLSTLSSLFANSATPSYNDKWQLKQIKKLWNFCSLMLHNLYGQSVNGPVMLQNKIQPESIKWLRSSNVAKTNATCSKRLNSNAVSTMFTLGFLSTLSFLFAISATSSYNDKWQLKQQTKNHWNFCSLVLHNLYGQSVSGPVMLQNKIQPESIKWFRPSNAAKTNAIGSKRLNSNAVSTKFTLAFPSTLSFLFAISATPSYNDKWQLKQIKKLWNFCSLMLHNLYGQSVNGPVMLQNKIQPESIKWLRPSNAAKTNATCSKRLISNADSTKFTLAFPLTLSSLFAISAALSYNEKWQLKQQTKKLWNFCSLMLHNLYGQSVNGPVMLQIRFNLNLSNGSGRVMMQKQMLPAQKDLIQMLFQQSLP